MKSKLYLLHVINEVSNILFYVSLLCTWIFALIKVISGVCGVVLIVFVAINFVMMSINRITNKIIYDQEAEKIMKIMQEQHKSCRTKSEN